MDAEFFATADEFEAWLEANGADADEVLVRMAKKAHRYVASLDWGRRRPTWRCASAGSTGARSASTTTGSCSASRRGARRATWSKGQPPEGRGSDRGRAGCGRPAWPRSKRAKADGRLGGPRTNGNGHLRSARWTLAAALEAGRPHRLVRGKLSRQNRYFDPAPRVPDGQEGRDTRAQDREVTSGLLAGRRRRPISAARSDARQVLAGDAVLVRRSPRVVRSTATALVDSPNLVADALCSGCRAEAAFRNRGIFGAHSKKGMLLGARACRRRKVEELVTGGGCRKNGPAREAGWAFDLGRCPADA